MPILKNCEVWFVRVNPKRPNALFNKKNPTWECQIRTMDKAQKAEWETKHNLQVKAVLPDDGPPYWRVNLRKKSFKTNGEKSSPVDVINGKMEEIDPDSIGNGSIANIRLFQYEYQKESGGKGIASVLMGLQVTKHILYVPRPRDDDFGETDSETIGPDSDGDDSTDSTPSTEAGKY